MNQVREAIGKFSPAGTPTTTSGGRALPFIVPNVFKLKWVNTSNKVMM
ncbi:hypothetical protein AAAC51_06775 [Priestia megaterium]